MNGTRLGITDIVAVDVVLLETLLPASILVGTVFLVILTTAVFEGGFARHIAQALKVLPMCVI